MHKQTQGRKSHGLPRTLRMVFSIILGALIGVAVLPADRPAYGNSVSKEPASAGKIPNKPIQRNPNQSPSGEVTGAAAMADFFTGTYAYEYSIDLPKMRAEPLFSPSLRYRSQTQRSDLGVGWLDLVESIRRQTRFDLDYNKLEFELDRFGAGADLVQVATSASEFRPVIESDFDQIVLTGGDQGTYWVRTDKFGKRYTYGKSPNDRIGQGNALAQTYEWLLSEISDTYGNRVEFTYTRPIDVSAAVVRPLLSSIRYIFKQPGGESVFCEVTLAYEPTPTQRLSYRPRFPVVSRYRLKGISVLAMGNPFASYNFAYRQGSYGKTPSLLSSITKVGSSGVSLPATKFEYSKDQPLWNQAASIGNSSPPDQFGITTFFGDFNGDGKVDLFSLGTAYPQPGGGRYWDRDIFASLFDGHHLGYRYGIRATEVAPDGLDWYIADVNGDGKADVVSIGYLDNDGWRSDEQRVFLSDGTKFIDRGFWSWATPKHFYTWDAHFVDVNGDGLADLVFEPDSHWSTVVALSDGKHFVSPTTWLTDRTTPRHLAVGRGLMTVDMNGDGLPDLVDILSDGTVNVALNEGTRFGGVYSWSKLGNGRLQNYCFADFNGDGLTDIAYFDQNTHGLRFRYSTGAGFDEEQTLKYDGAVTGDNFSLQCGDVNGDGLADVVVVSPQSKGVPRIDIAFATGTSLLWDYSQDAGIKAGAIQDRFHLLDVDGRGAADLLYYAPSGELDLQTSAETIAPLLSRIENPSGGVVKIEYSGSSQFLNKNLPFSLPVVTRITESDRLGQESVSTIEYSGGYYHAQTRDFRGFAAAALKHEGLRGQSSFMVKYEFNQGGSDGGNADVRGPAALKGTLKEKTISDASDRVISKNSYHYYDNQSTDSGSWYMPLKVTSSEACDGGTSCLIENEKYQYDGHGNVTVRTRESLTPTENKRWEYRSVYAAEQGSGIYGLPIGAEVYDASDEANEKLLSRIAYYYDDAPTIAKPPLNVKIGRLTSIVGWNSAGNDASVSIGYDSVGNVVQLVGPDKVSNSFQYDSNGNFVVGVTRGGQPLTSLTYYGVDGQSVSDGVFGLLKTVRNVTGRGNLDVKYDGLGRVATITRPDSAPWQITYDDQTRTGPDISVKVGDDILDEYYSDGFGRLLHQVRSDRAGHRVSTDRLYSSTGRLSMVSEPYLEGVTPTRSFINYDAAGRVNRVVDPVGTQSTWCFKGAYADRIEIRKRADGAEHMLRTREAYDAFGNIISVGQFFSPASGCDIGAAPDFTTKFAWDFRNHLVSAETVAGRAVHIAYSSLGQVTSIERPDAGPMRVYYDGAMSPKTFLAGSSCKFDAPDDKQPASCWVARYGYDNLARLSSEVYELGGQKPYKVQRTYEPNPSGLIATAASPDVKSEFSFDTAARLSRVAIHVPSRFWGENSFEWRMQYDPLGRVARDTYPGGAVDWQYEGLWATGVKYNNAPLVQMSNQDGLGRPGLMTFADGSLEKISRSSNGLIERVDSTTAGGKPILSEEYQHQGEWVSSIRTNEVVQEFDYDYAGRLQAEKGARPGQWSFDPEGRLIADSSVGSIHYDNPQLPFSPTQFGATGVISQENFGVVGWHNKEGALNFNIGPNGRPDKVKGKSQSGTGNVSASYTYDSFGNLVERKSGGWGPFGHRLRSFFGTTYCRDQACSVIVRIGDRPVAQVQKGKSPTYFHTSATADVMARTQAGSVVGGMGEYSPWGRTLHDPYGPKEFPTIGASGLEFDRQTGFAAAGARFYSPTFERFTSPDSELGDLLHPGALNPYAYAANSPLNFTDPRGFDPEPSGGSSVCQWTGNDCGGSGSDGGFGWLFGSGGGGHGVPIHPITFIPQASTQYPRFEPAYTFTNRGSQGPLASSQTDPTGWLGKSLVVLGGGIVGMALVVTAPVSAPAGAFAILTASMACATGGAMTVTSLVAMGTLEQKNYGEFSRAMSIVSATGSPLGQVGAVTGGMMSGGSEHAIRTGAAVGDLAGSVMSLTSNVDKLTTTVDTEQRFILRVISTINTSTKLPNKGVNTVNLIINDPPP
jgi:RHS repeat-associated protein